MTDKTNKAVEITPEEEKQGLKIVETTADEKEQGLRGKVNAVPFGEKISAIFEEMEAKQDADLIPLNAEFKKWVEGEVCHCIFLESGSMASKFKGQENYGIVKFLCKENGKTVSCISGDKVLVNALTSGDVKMQMGQYFRVVYKGEKTNPNGTFADFEIFAAPLS